MKYLTSFFILCALATSSCEKKEPTQTQSTNLTTAPASNTTGIQLKSELASIAQHLDTDGEHFSVTKTAGDLEALSFIIDAIISVIPEEELSPDFNLSLQDTLKKSGLDHIVAKGQSSNYTDGHWHNRTFYATKGPRQGLLSLLGTEAAPFQSPSFAPANTDFLFETELNLKELKSLSEHIASSFGQEPKRSFAEAMQQKLMGLGMSTGDILGKFDARLSLALTADATQKWQANSDGPELPTMDLVLRIDGVNWLWDEYGETLEKNATVREEGNKKYLSFEDDIPTPMGSLTPIILVDNDANQTWFALQEKTLEACLSDSPKLAQSKPFHSALQGLPEKGNTLSFISKNLCQIFMTTPLAESGAFESEEQIKAISEQISAFIIRSEVGYAAVIANEKDGIMFASNSPLSNKNGSSALMATSSVALIPSLFVGANIYKEGADRAACIINLRNIHLAIRADQHLTEKNIGDPLDLSEIFGPENYLERPTCPLGHTYTIVEAYPPIGTAAAQCEHPEHHPKDTAGW